MGMCRGVRIGITGKPGIGKSTVVRKVLKSLRDEHISAGGILTEELRKNKMRVGFIVEDISTGDRGILAHIEIKGKPKVGKYGVNIAELEHIGVKAIRNAIDNADVIIIDEIGPMELKSDAFVNAVEDSVKSGKCMIVTVHLRSNHALVRNIKKTFKMFEVTISNRDRLPAAVIRNIL